VKSEQDWLHFF